MKPYYRMTVDRLKGKYTTHTVELTSQAGNPHESKEVIERPDHTFVDEVVISPWLHVEAMSRREFWVNVAGVTLWVRLRKDGSVKSVRVYEAGDYDEPHEGVKYVYGDEEE